MDYVALSEKIFRELCVIPAPSGKEEKRAEYCLNKLKEFGIEGYIDKAKNVIYLLEGEKEDITVFQAHTDVVFPDEETLPFSEDEENIYCPGCGDDTIEVALLLGVIKKITDEKIKPKNSVLFVLNSCEEGLGNLKGTREIFASYGNRIKELYTFDGQTGHVVNKSVGSHRYKVTVKTVGGHSYNDFGNENAARVLAEAIQLIYQIKVPEKDTTTYNVGVISGGTSVNTIIQQAEMLCEYRSDNFENLEYMKKEFKKVFDYISTLADVTVELVGDRPCGNNLDEEKMRAMTEFACAVQEKHGKCKVKVESGSTDCNIPHSLGIEAVCVGAYLGGGAHTREEWLKKDSFALGFAITEEIVKSCF